MASYNGIVIALNQPGVDALKDLAEALPGAKDDMSVIAKNLRKTIDMYGNGLGVKKDIYDEIVSEYEKIINGIGSVLVDVSVHMKYTAEKMQEYIDESDGGHGSIAPKVKQLR